MSEPIARRIRTWVATLVAVTGAATMQADADTIYVNPNCGDDAWTGENPECAAPNGPYRTIQRALNEGMDGDTVILADGTYVEGFVTFGPGKNMVVRSENGPSDC